MVSLPRWLVSTCVGTSDGLAGHVVSARRASYLGAARPSDFDQTWTGNAKGLCERMPAWHWWFLGDKSSSWADDMVEIRPRLEWETDFSYGNACPAGITSRHPDSTIRSDELAFPVSLCGMPLWFSRSLSCSGVLGVLIRHKAEESLAKLDANKSGNLIYSVPAPEVAFCAQEDANLVASTMELTVDTSVYDPAYYCHQLKPSPRPPSHRTVSRTQELTTM